MNVTDDLIQQARETAAEATSGTDPDHPRFHVAPPVGRLNDPNGLVVLGDTYHVFYQYSPFFPSRRLVFWGHATSTDLRNWEHHAPALAPDAWYDRSGAYSGTALVEDGRLLLYYTGNVKNPDFSRDTYQCLVTTDDLKAFTKSPANPLIPGPPPGYTTHFRDPQVWREGPDYRMCLGAQRADETGCALLFRSSDGLHWAFEAELTLPDADGRFDDFGYMWECPSLFPLTDSETGERRHVLLFCPQGAAFADGYTHNRYPCGYVVGTLVGTELRNTGEFWELDRGFEFYAPQVFAREPARPGPTTLMGWVGNPDEDDQPSLDHGWVHALSVPRELSLKAGRIRQRPVLQAGTADDGLSHQPLTAGGTTLRDADLVLSELTGQRCFSLELDLALDADARCTLRLGSSPDSAVILTLEQGILTVDRSATRYPLGDSRRVPLPGGNRCRLHVIRDRSILEIFLDDGEESFTLRIFLDPGTDEVGLRAEGTVDIVSARAAELC